MRRIIIVLFSALLSGAAIAQEEETLILKTTQDFAKNFYAFSSFTKGIVYYTYGGSSIANFNYNLVTSEMLFISKEGDTLAMANPESISVLVIDKKTYYYENGFLEQVYGNDSTRLVKKVRAAIETENIGGYGMSEATGAVNNNRTYIDRGFVYDLSINREYIFKKYTTYFWMAKDKRTLKATKGNLIEMFPDKKSSINRFVKEHKTDFHSETSLLKLLAFTMGDE